VNEGVGGAVEGQATESLLVNERTGEVRLLAHATSPTRSVLATSGGITRAPASGAEAVLTREEIAQLIELSREVPNRFSTLRDELGNPLPADIEFAFRNGRLTLLQIRPFVESKSAQKSRYLLDLDAQLRARGSTVVLRDVAPGESK
jgi:hypothetical protein